MLEKIINEIIPLEWEMFSAVNNYGGKASCQSRPLIFEIMRKSQFLTWNEEILESYLADLERAKLLNRNLCTEKYGYMMEKTSPGEYERIRKMLPKISEQKKKQIEQIVKVHIEWEHQVSLTYPKVQALGRPIEAAEDIENIVSVETYLRGELMTYSERTITLMCAYVLECRAKGRNLAVETLAHTAQMYGCASIEELEKSVVS